MGPYIAGFIVIFNAPVTGVIRTTRRSCSTYSHALRCAKASTTLAVADDDVGQNWTRRPGGVGEGRIYGERSRTMV